MSYIEKGKISTDSPFGGGDLLLYSLPYVESVHEDYEEYALALIEEEMKAISPHYLKKIPPLNFRTSIMEKEYESITDKKSLNTNSNSQQQPCYRSRKIAKPTSIEEWMTDAGRNAVEQAKSLYEGERIRGMVLEAEKEECVAIWKDYISNLDDRLKRMKDCADKQVEIVEEINFQRQQAQERQFWPELEQLNQEYQQALYNRNLLEHRLEALRRRGIRSSVENHNGIDSCKRTVDQV